MSPVAEIFGSLSPSGPHEVGAYDFPSFFHIFLLKDKKMERKTDGVNRNKKMLVTILHENSRRLAGHFALSSMKICTEP